MLLKSLPALTVTTVVLALVALLGLSVLLWAPARSSSSTVVANEFPGAVTREVHDREEVPDAVVLITGTGLEGSWACSGFLVGPHSVATAAHCVQPLASYAVEVGVRRAGDGVRVAEVCTADRALGAGAYHSAEPGEKDQFDYAILGIDACDGVRRSGPGISRVELDREVGARHGYLQLGIARDGDVVRSVGYPSDKPENTLWTSSGMLRSASWVDARCQRCSSWKLVANVHAAPGSSGGPFVDRRGHAVGIISTVETVVTQERPTSRTTARAVAPDLLEEFGRLIFMVDPTSSNAVTPDGP